MIQSIKSIAPLLAGTALLSAATHMAIYSPTQTVAHKLVTIDSVTFSAAADSMIVNKKDARLAYAVASIDSIRYRTAPERMTFIPAKNCTYTRGASFQYVSKWSKPEHLVSFTRDFYMDTTEVTQKQASTIMKAYYPQYSLPSWKEYSVGVGDNKPAYYANFWFAVLYCNALSKSHGLDTVYSYSSIKDSIQSNKNIEPDTLRDLMINYDRVGYRLPTDAEREYATRAGSKMMYYWGSDSDIGKYAVYNPNGQTPGVKVADVATKLPNKFGLYDMVGNVSEWCNDYFAFYDEILGGAKSLTDPTGPEKPTMYGLRRTVRGSRYGSAENQLTSDLRDTLSMSTAGTGIGFRVVLPIVK